jgi:hypothetical protein
VNSDFDFLFEKLIARNYEIKNALRIAV